MNQVELTPSGWIIAIFNLNKFYKELNLEAGFNEKTESEEE